jgi:hypothetical protein
VHASAGSECEPGEEKQGVVAARIVAEAIIVFRAAVELRVDGVLDTKLQVARGLPHESSLPNGTQSASMMKLLLFGLPLALPLIGWGCEKGRVRVAQVFCHPR